MSHNVARHSSCSTALLHLSHGIAASQWICRARARDAGKAKSYQYGLIDTCEIAADPALDCNLNGALDTCDIAGGAQDNDADARLDACEVARGDFNLDDSVGAADLAQLLDLWGLQNPSYGDLNGDGIVGAQDLAMLLDNWGPLY